MISPHSRANPSPLRSVAATSADDAGRGDAMHGDAMHGDAMHGDVIHGKAMHGKAMHSDATRGDATRGNATRGGVWWKRAGTLLLGDVVGTLSMMGFVYLLTSLVVPAYAWSVVEAIPVVLGVAVAAFALAGLYNSTLVHPAVEMKRSSAVVAAVGVTAGLTILLAAGTPAAAALVVTGGLIGAVVVPVTRTLSRILCAHAPWWGRRTLVIDADGRGERVIDTLQRWPELGLRPVGRLTDDPAPSASDVPVLGTLRDAAQLAQTYDASSAIVSVPTLDAEARAKLLDRLSRFFDHIIDVSDAPASRVLWRTQRSREGIEGYEVRHFTVRPLARAAKRAVDLVGGGLLLLAASPLFAAIAAAIKYEEPGGSVFYKQERMGREGRCFSVLKFRTMHENADQRLKTLLDENPALAAEYAEKHKLENDPRVTTVGRWLRRRSLDELPQLLNVLWGDMSLVGPRAYLFRELPQMRGSHAELMNRIVLQTPPGITGLWQVSGRNQLSFTDRIDLDVHYIQNWSPWLDAYLLVRTVPVVLSGDGAC